MKRSILGIFRSFVIICLLLCVFSNNVQLVSGSNLLSSSNELPEDSKAIYGDMIDSKANIYNDAKFSFNFKKINNQICNITVTRKDTSFDNHWVQFIFHINILDNQDHIATLVGYIALEPGQKSVTATKYAPQNSKIIGVKTNSYGIKFPNLDENEKESLHDSLFSLKLSAPYRSFGWSYIDYEFLNRENIPLNCTVKLRRAINLNFKEGVETEWVSLVMNPYDQFKKDSLFWGPELNSFQTSSEEYYLQFLDHNLNSDNIYHPA